VRRFGQRKFRESRRFCTAINYGKATASIQQVMVQNSYLSAGDPFAQNTSRLDVLTCVSAASFWKPLSALGSSRLARAPFVFGLTGLARPDFVVRMKVS
jgi:hypothetical protein